MKQILVAGLHDHIEHIFSVIALPICTAPPLSVSLSLVSSAELKVAPVNPVAACPPANCHDVIAGLGFFLDFINGDQPDIPAIDQGVAQERSSKQIAPLTVGIPMRFP